MTNNERIRQIMRAEKISLWVIGEKLGVSEWTIGRWTRRPLTDELERKFYDAIECIRKEREVHT